ncbi:MAG: AAA family ATPase [Bacillota bacterium]|nr:AAA family ATPase [Bacillota bacterium]
MDRQTGRAGNRAGAPAAEPQRRVRFLGSLRHRIFVRDDFSIWAVAVADEPLIDPDGEAQSRLVILGEGIDSHPPEVTVDIAGVWEKRSGYDDWQVRAWYVTPALPTGREGMLRFLESDYIKGCGPARARSIVDRFGAETWAVIEREPERLQEIPGIGKKIMKMIHKSYLKNISVRDVISELAPYGVSPRLAVRIAHKFPGAVGLIRQDPWQLCGEGIGVGFHTADLIAEANGVDPLSPSRLVAGFDYIFTMAEPSGHCYLTGEQLLTEARELFAKSRPHPDVIPALPGVLEEQIRRGHLVREHFGAPPGGGPDLSLPIYTHHFWKLESDAAQYLWNLLAAHRAAAADTAAAQRRRLRAEREVLVDRVAQRLGFVPAAAQREAAVRFGIDPVLILTGYPGSGKTTTLRLILETMDLPPDAVLLCAPTGRAARRMSEQTKRRAVTIHQALTLDPETGEMPDDCLPFAAVIVDEASMVDIRLLGQLLSRLKPDCRLLFCGDPWQLPSVGPGNVLNDLIRSGVIPLVELTEIFRQEDGSEIAHNAAQIRAGRCDLVYNANFAFRTAETSEAAADLVERLLLRAIEFVGDEEQVVCLTPFRTRTAAGADALNERLREKLNPPAPGRREVRHGEHVFRENDRVMLTRNSRLPYWDREAREASADLGQVSNGDIGRILRIREDEDDKSYAVVRFNDSEYYLSAEHFTHLDWAYATTVHKSQGSEYQFVIVVMLRSHYVMLKRNLIYTALTRAKQNVIIIGQKEAVNQAIRTPDSARRQTGLAERLQLLAGSEPGAPPVEAAAAAIADPEEDDDDDAGEVYPVAPPPRLELAQPPPVPGPARAPARVPASVSAVPGPAAPRRFGEDIAADLASIAHIKL